MTDNIERRLKEHNEGKSLASKPYRPYLLIFYESFINNKDAKRREKYLKSGWGRKSIKKLLKNYFEKT